MRSNRKINLYVFLTMLVLFCVFAFVFLLLVSVGGGVYKKALSRMDESYEIRTTLSYVANKVRAVSGEDVHVMPVDGKNVLVIDDASVEGEYVTYIYYYDGALQEIYQHKNKALEMEYGEEIVRTGGVQIEEKDGLLAVEMETNGGTSERISMYLPGMSG